MHLNTVEHHSPFGKSGADNPFPVGLNKSSSVPNLAPFNTPFSNIAKLPNIQPVLQTAGAKTVVEGNPVAGSNFPTVPPVPLIPPSLFGTHPSMPELKDPLYRRHWNSSVYDRLGPYPGYPYDHRYRNHPDYYTGRNGLLYGYGEVDDKKLRRKLYGADLLD